MKDKITENDEAYIQNAKAEQALMDETYTNLGISLHNPTDDNLQKASLVNAIYNQKNDKSGIKGNMLASITNEYATHVQLFRNYGKNFGFFKDSQVKFDDDKYFEQYKIGYNKKYNAEAIDAAMEIYTTRGKYRGLTYNCRFVKYEILKLAEQITKEMDIKFILNLKK